jgi:hypothetical protein
VETLQKFALNPFLKDTLDVAISHFGTQGDGNHFFFVGVQESTGKTAIVTHHGSRKPGALLYKNGIRKAQSIRMKYCPEVSDFNAWLVADSKDGQDYWNALQLIKSWTYENHYAIHREVARRLNVVQSVLDNAPVAPEDARPSERVVPARDNPFAGDPTVNAPVPSERTTSPDELTVRNLPLPAIGVLVESKLVNRNPEFPAVP